MNNIDTIKPVSSHKFNNISFGNKYYDNNDFFRKTETNNNVLDQSSLEQPFQNDKQFDRISEQVLKIRRYFEENKESAGVTSPLYFKQQNGQQVHRQPEVAHILNKRPETDFNSNVASSSSSEVEARFLFPTIQGQSHTSKNSECGIGHSRNQNMAMSNLQISNQEGFPHYSSTSNNVSHQNVPIPLPAGTTWPPPMCLNEYLNYVQSKRVLFSADKIPGNSLVLPPFLFVAPLTISELSNRIKIQQKENANLLKPSNYNKVILKALDFQYKIQDIADQNKPANKHKIIVAHTTQFPPSQSTASYQPKNQHCQNICIKKIYQFMNIKGVESVNSGSKWILLSPQLIVNVLEEVLKVKQNLSSEESIYFTKQLGLIYDQVKSWFRNGNAKTKKTGHYTGNQTFHPAKENLNYLDPTNVISITNRMDVDIAPHPIAKIINNNKGKFQQKGISSLLNLLSLNEVQENPTVNNHEIENNVDHAKTVSGKKHFSTSSEQPKAQQIQQRRFPISLYQKLIIRRENRYQNYHQNRRRMIRNYEIEKELEEVFETKQYITVDEEKKLSKRLGVTIRQLKVWFQNRRKKDRTIRSMTDPRKGGRKDIIYALTY